VKDLGITTAKIAADAVTTAKIPNRTRSVFVSASGVADAISSGNDIGRNEHAGFEINNTSIYVAFGEFIVPRDFVSGMTVKAVFQPGGSGNAYVKSEARYGASGEAYSNHTDDDGGYAAIAVTNALLSVVQSVSLSNAAIGDYVTMTWYRDGTHGSDTVEAFIYFKGWLVEYTADS
jgi:hypothetical protein